MAAEIVVEFDGKVFVPAGPVPLPAGAKAIVRVSSPIAMSYASPPPPPLTPEDRQRWEELTRIWEQAEWPWESVEHALGRPRYEP